MTQHEFNHSIANVTDVNFKSNNVLRRPCLAVTQIGKLIGERLAAFAQRHLPFQQDDIRINIGKTRIKVRVIKSTYSKRQRRVFALATAEYIVRCLSTGTLSQLEGDLKKPTSSTAPSVGDIGPVEAVG